MSRENDPIAGLAVLIIAVSLGSTVALILLQSGQGWLFRSIRFVVTVVFCMLLIQRVVWARWLLALSHIVSVFFLLRGFYTIGLSSSMFWAVWFLAMAALYGYLAYQLTLSRKISDAF